MFRLYSTLYYYGRTEGLPWRIARYLAEIEHRFFAFDFEARPDTPSGYWPVKLTFFAEPHNKLLLWRNADRQWCASAEGLVPVDVVQQLKALRVRF